MSKPIENRSARTRRPALAASLVVLSGALCAAGAAPVHAQQAGIRGTFDSSTDDRLLILRNGEAAADATTEPEGLQPGPYEPESDGGNPVNIFSLNGDEPGADGETGAGNASAAIPSGPSLREIQARRQKREQNTAERLEQARTDRMAPPRDTAANEDDTDEELQTGAIRAEAERPLGTEEDAGAVTAENTAIEGRGINAEDDPFAPLGIRVGTFTWVPMIEQGVEATISGGTTTYSSSTTLSLEGTSDRSSGSDTITGFVRYNQPFDSTVAEDIEFGGTLSSSFDFADGWRGTVDGSVDRQRESATAPVALPGVPDRPYRTLASGTLGLEKTVGKARGRLAASVERADYEDATLSTGVTFSQKDRNNTLLTASLRTGYEISPALIPFLEIEGGRRLYDLDLDRNGYNRDSTRLSLRAGTAFDFGEKLGGEISAGWMRETFDDDRLAAVSGLRLDASVNWSPVRETLVALNVSSVVEGTTDPGASGSIRYDANLNVSRQIFANLLAEGRLGIGYRDFSGTGAYDVIYSGEAGATWWVNRNLGLTGRARYEQTVSSDPTRDNDELTIFAGIRARR